VLDLVVVPPGAVVDGAFLDVGQRGVALGEQVVVEALLELAGLTEPAGTSFSRHLVTYLAGAGTGGPGRRVKRPGTGEAGPGRDLGPTMMPQNLPGVCTIPPACSAQTVQSCRTARLESRRRFPSGPMSPPDILVRSGA
jgi:hypothetical protein